MVTDLLARPEVDFSDLVSDMRTEMEASGLMHSVALHRYEIAIAREIELSRGVASGQLRRYWNRLFPGVDFTEELLTQQLEAALKRWKVDAMERFQQTASEVLSVKTVQNRRTGQRYFFRQTDLRLRAAAVLSVVTVPILITQIFAASNWQLNLGIWGLVLNVIALVVLTISALHGKRRRS